MTQISSSSSSSSAMGAEGLGSRKVALHLLEQILDKGRPLDQLLDGDEAFKSLVSRDRAFARMLTATALRRLGQIDDLIIRAMEKKEAPRPSMLHHLLRIGVTQIMFMAAPDYAVVDTAVRLAEQSGLERQKGLVNAVLRRVAREHRDWLGKQDDGRINTPDWLLQTWIADYGLREAAEIAQANLSEAPLDISIKSPGMRDYWVGVLDAHVLPTGTLRRESGGMVYDLPGFDDGQWWVQDAAAALPARLFGDVAGKTIYDLCAAPGGKTAQLAALGAQVVALDRSAKRLQRLTENMARLKLSDRVKTEVSDAAAWTPREKADFILLDAPCSATGTLRRHPDVAYLKSPQDVARLCDAQGRLLAHAVEQLAPGGVLVYCTCSLQKDEGERQIERLLASGAPVQRKAIDAAEVGDLEALVTPEGDVRVLPYHLAAHGGMDGFYIARLVKS